MKTITTMLLASIFCVGCSEKKKNENNTSEANAQLVQSVFQHFNQHDWEGMAQLYIENAEFKDPEYGSEKVTKTRADIVKHYTELSQMFPDVKDEIIAIYASGNKHVIVEFVSSGTAPDGTRFTLPICAIFTIEDGMITKDYNYYDNF